MYVLTSHHTSGAAVVLASLLHDNGIAVTVGEPTGEGPSFNYANASPEKLPVTGWTYVLARCEGQSRPRNLDPYVTSLYPDIPSYTTRADLLAGTDSQMGAVKQVIASKPEDVITPIAEREEPEEPIDTRVWAPADLTSYVTYFSYSQKFDYFIIKFAEPIEVLNPKGIKVTDQTGKELGLRNVCIAINYDNILIVALSKTISDADRCIVTLPASAVSLATGLTNATMTLDGYKYNPYRPEVVVTPVTPPDPTGAVVEDWTKGALPPFIRSLSYSERFHYFIVIFDQPILALDPNGIKVATASGQEMALRYTPNLTHVATDTLIISPRDWVAETDSCIITLPAKAILLQDGFTNPATLELGKYKYNRYP